MKKSLICKIGVLALTGLLFSGCARMNMNSTVKSDGSGTLETQVNIKKTTFIKVLKANAGLVTPEGPSVLSNVKKILPNDTKGDDTPNFSYEDISKMTDEQITAELIKEGFTVVNIDGEEYFNIPSENGLGLGTIKYDSIADYYTKAQVGTLTTDAQDRFSLSETSVELTASFEDMEDFGGSSFDTEMLGALGITADELKDVKATYSFHFDTEIEKASDNAILSDDKKTVSFVMSLEQTSAMQCYAYCKNDINVTDVNNGMLYGKKTTIKLPSGVSATVNGTAVSGSEITINKSGTYDIKMKSSDGTQETLFFAVDLTAPTVSGIKNKGFYKKNTKLYVSDENGLKDVTLDGKSILSSLIYDDLNSDTSIDFLNYKGRYSFNMKSLKEGKHTLTATDTLGNKRTVTFTFDKTAPSVKGVKNGKAYKGKVTIKFSDKFGVKKATLNGKKISSGKKVSKKGKYTLKVTDKAGNVATVKFTIKKSKKK